MPGSMLCSLKNWLNKIPVHLLWLSLFQVAKSRSRYRVKGKGYQGFVLHLQMSTWKRSDKSNWEMSVTWEHQHKVFQRQVTGSQYNATHLIGQPWFSLLSKYSQLKTTIGHTLGSPRVKLRTSHYVPFKYIMKLLELWNWVSNYPCPLPTHGLRLSCIQSHQNQAN